MNTNEKNSNNNCKSLMLSQFFLSQFGCLLTLIARKIATKTNKMKKKRYAKRCMNDEQKKNKTNITKKDIFVEFNLKICKPRAIFHWHREYVQHLIFIYNLLARINFFLVVFLRIPRKCHIQIQQAIIVSRSQSRAKRQKNHFDSHCLLTLAYSIRKLI